MSLDHAVSGPPEIIYRRDGHSCPSPPMTRFITGFGFGIFAGSRVQHSVGDSTVDGRRRAVGQSPPEQSPFLDDIVNARLRVEHASQATCMVVHSDQAAPRGDQATIGIRFHESGLHTGSRQPRRFCRGHVAHRSSYKVVSEFSKRGSSGRRIRSPAHPNRCEPMPASGGTQAPDEALGLVSHPHVRRRRNASVCQPSNCVCFTWYIKFALSLRVRGE
jgi:hypothetical protein